MLFLAGLFAGVVLGFFIAGLCHIAAKKEEGHIEHISPPLANNIGKVA